MQFYKLKGLKKMLTDRLLELLKEKGLKQKDLIEAIGIGKNQILYWKKNGVVPNKVIQKDIADYFIIHNILYLYRAFTSIYCAKNEVVTF